MGAGNLWVPFACPAVGGAVDYIVVTTEEGEQIVMFGVAGAFLRKFDGRDSIDDVGAHDLEA